MSEASCEALQIFQCHIVWVMVFFQLRDSLFHASWWKVFFDGCGGWKGMERYNSWNNFVFDCRQLKFSQKTTFWWFFPYGPKDFINWFFEIDWARFEVDEVALMKFPWIKKLIAICSKNFLKLQLGYSKYLCKCNWETFG